MVSRQPEEVVRHSRVGAPDFDLSPYTGWTRADWAGLADRLLLAVRPHASPGHALITPPGPPAAHGPAVDGLEGFARTFLLAGFCLAGHPESDPLNLAEWYAQGLRAGVDPAAPDRWVRLDEQPQAKVEAASLAIGLDLTRRLIWDRLDDVVRQRLIDYLAPAVGDNSYPPNNWAWFRICVETFARGVGGAWSRQDVADDLARLDGFRRADGWRCDGAERAFDHYSGWALQVFPTLWQRMTGADQLVDDAWRAQDRADLDRYLADAICLVGADGAPLIQGRSLIYRFAAAAPFWAGAMAGVPGLPAGLARRAASGIARYFVDAGVPGGDGLLTLGWIRACPGLAQSYSGPASPYWAAMGFLGLALPADDAVWTAVEQPLPVEGGDVVRALAAPGWAVSATRADGIVRLANHGTDHARPGATGGDSPLYAMIGYATAVAPLVGPAAYRQPAAQYVALADRAGWLTHRAGFVTAACGGAADVVWAASRLTPHWLRPTADQEDHGGGWSGQGELAGRGLVISVLRGPWECRCVRLESVEPRAVELRVAGWATSRPTLVSPVPGVDFLTGLTAGDVRSACANNDRLVNAITAVTTPTRGGVALIDDANPMGEPSGVPYLVFPAKPGEWVVCLLTLSGVDQPTICRQAAVAARPGGWEVAVTWPDGRSTATLIEDSGLGHAQPATTSKGEQ